MQEMQVQTKERRAYDVIVVGGGIAGVSAAVSAARLGKTTLLIEKQINLGGMATVGLISWYEPLCDGDGKQMVGGMAEELIKLAIQNGFDNLPERWGGESGNAPHRVRYATYFSPTFFSLSLDRFVEESGAEILFDTYATYPVMEGQVCRGVITENADGRSFYPAKVVIDCTGDGSIFARAGVETEFGENYLTYVVHETDHEKAKVYVETGDMTKLRSWKNGGSNMRGEGHPEGMRKLTAETAQDINEYIAIGKRRLMKKYEGTNRFEREILTLPTMPHYRVIRRIKGAYTFTGEELGVRFADSVGSTGDFRCRGKHYHVPYRCLYNAGYPNLLAAGRIVSAVGDGMEVLRVIPSCALTGQAAGVAASLAIEANASVADVDVAELQKQLKARNVLFED
jgi:hypothetical protein